MIYFCKMQATGNDFIIINVMMQKFRYSYGNLAKFLCNRKYGVGADGVIFIEKSEVAEYKMRIFNSDGTEAGMCGNGIRCLAKYLYEESMVSSSCFKIETISGIKELELSIENKTVSYIKVCMGNPIFEYNKIPVIFPNILEKSLQSLEIDIEDKKYIGFPISMGNPHFVIFENELDKIDLEKIGRSIENYKYFPYKTNVEFVKIINRNKIKMLVWERGVGETFACGTGAVAAAYAMYIENKIKNNVVVELEGGKLNISIDEKTNEVYMEGPAVNIFNGEIDL